MPEPQVVEVYEVHGRVPTDFEDSSFRRMVGLEGRLDKRRNERLKTQSVTRSPRVMERKEEMAWTWREDTVESWCGLPCLWVPRRNMSVPREEGPYGKEETGRTKDRGDH